MEFNLSALVIYAILSLIVERGMEVFSESRWFRDKKAQIEETKSRIADLETVGDFISGVIIGSGTKPTHDLIAIIEKVVKK